MFTTDRCLHPAHLLCFRSGQLTSLCANSCSRDPPAPLILRAVPEDCLDSPFSCTPSPPSAAAHSFSPSTELFKTKGSCCLPVDNTECRQGERPQGPSGKSALTGELGTLAGNTIYHVVVNSELSPSPSRFKLYLVGAQALWTDPRGFLASNSQGLGIKSKIGRFFSSLE